MTFNPAFYSPCFTWYWNKSMPLFVKTSECFPNFIFYLIIMQFSKLISIRMKNIKKLQFFLKYGKCNSKYLWTHLVISQANSLKLISPFPSWSISLISSWIFNPLRLRPDGKSFIKLKPEVQILLGSNQMFA